jgi:precorrin-8X/cobalt-precorrin-8 methylmutase
VTDSGGPAQPGKQVQNSEQNQAGWRVHAGEYVRASEHPQAGGQARASEHLAASGHVDTSEQMGPSQLAHPSPQAYQGELVHPIEAEAYRIMHSRMDLSHLPPLSRAVTERVVHASADFDYVTDLVCDEAALAAGLAALAAGVPVVVDVEMVAAGITARPVICKIRESLTTRLSRTVGITRAAAGIRLAFTEAGPGAVWVVGCAPTAVAEILTRDVQPVLVIGLPVGFVGAAEAKDALRASGLPALTNVSEKGGSAVASAALNALLRAIPSVAYQDRGNRGAVDRGAADRGRGQGPGPGAGRTGQAGAGLPGVGEIGDPGARTGQNGAGQRREPGAWRDGARGCGQGGAAEAERTGRSMGSDADGPGERPGAGGSMAAAIDPRVGRGDARRERPGARRGGEE